MLMMVRAPQPDLMIAADAESVAVRGADGKFVIIRSGNDTFATREWLAADADQREVKHASLMKGVMCDHAGCIAMLEDGRLIAVARTAEAFEEDCVRAAVVITRRLPAHWRCGASARASKLCPRVRRPTIGRGRRKLRHLQPSRPDSLVRRPPQSRISYRAIKITVVQYFRNRPTSLPWMRTRFGGRILTS